MMHHELSEDNQAIMSALYQAASALEFFMKRPDISAIDIPENIEHTIASKAHDDLQNVWMLLMGRVTGEYEE